MSLDLKKLKQDWNYYRNNPFENKKFNGLISSRDLEFVGKGFYSSFYKIQGTDLGIKVFNFTDDRSLEEIKKEYANLKIAKKIGVNVPEVYGVNPILKKDGSFAKNLGIVMDFLDGKIIEDMKLKYNDLIIQKFLEQKKLLKRFLIGREFKDIREYNAIWLPNEKKVYLIDAGFWDFDWQGNGYKSINLEEGKCL